jgi:hypothetical protein
MAEDSNAPLKATYGIGEWFAKPYAKLNTDDRKAFLRAVKKPSNVTCRPKQSCLAAFPEAISNTACNKKGGVCSLRLYQQHKSGFQPSGEFCITCPNRFLEGGAVFEWVGNTILGTNRPRILREIQFLQGTVGETDEEKEVGQIDHVLVTPSTSPFEWCAVEMQSVYFSGDNMGIEFVAIKGAIDAPIMPAGKRHPDFRSSGPKRLMPQLQVKVPTLRRWGKKMAVVVDEMFFGSLGAMDEVADISNCDIVWFVVGITEDGSTTRLVPKFRRLTTLERAVEGLTGGRPVSKARFEESIARRLAKVQRAAMRTDAK